VIERTMALRTFTGLFSLCAVLGLYFAVRNAGDSLSPQGCRMSWMSPSYVLQTGMNDTWSPLASRYSLWLYREVGWDSAVVRQTGIFIKRWKLIKL
jgi:glycosylphosphatidylinositol deacylase